MKPTKADQQNVRIIAIARGFVLLPFTLVMAVAGLGKRLFQRVQNKSPQQLRADDATRQSRVRRELRGLPPDHIQETPKSS